ncbi:DUF1353 domain-containing protein [Calothrix rhizosoleniae]|uniref:DUF1353 domain-containing protein n=1 Tax=Calothrix rhizosoleniae TaxID=888997 RepID=UPI000B499970|nr:DUF1353 domain-containing protein [Calothrix rhizosoleniae]
MMQCCTEQERTELTLAKVSYHPKKNRWFLREKYCYQDKNKKSEITLYEGFDFDLATIPRPFWKIIAIHELSIEATSIHDFMYYTQGGQKTHAGNQKILGSIEPKEVIYSRKDADYLFLKMMEEAGISKWRRFLAYIGVRIFGIVHWPCI